jgi:hypothetical protein
MSFASDFRAVLREETDEELHLMVSDDTVLAAMARDEIARRERTRSVEVSNG